MAARTLTVGALAALLLVACEPPSSDSATGGASTGTTGNEELGSISMSLTLSGLFRFAQLDYHISGNGFDRADSVDISKSATPSVIVGGVPFGHGYHVTLTARDVKMQLTPCQGSATFDVTSSAITAVPVGMTCREAATPVAAPVSRTASFSIAVLLLALGSWAVRNRYYRQGSKPDITP